MRARAFFYVCAGVLMLAVAYTLGAGQAVSQTGGTVAAAYMQQTTGIATMWVLTDSGDIYNVQTKSSPPYINRDATFAGNIFGTVSVKPSAMGEVKGKYREED